MKYGGEIYGSKSSRGTYSRTYAHRERSETFGDV
jgi:hypothetical protein